MRSELKVFACLVGIIAPCLSAGPTLAADETYSAIDAIPVPIMQACPSATLVCNPDKGLGSFDISFVDPFAGVYLLADRSNSAVDVVELGNDLTVARQLTGCGTSPCPVGSPNAFAGHVGSTVSGPNGVITANDQKEVWAGDGNSTAKVLDLKTGVLLHSIPTINPSTGKPGTGRADELCEDPVHRIVLIANDEPTDLFVTFISTKTYAVLGAFKLDGSDATHNAKGINATDGIEQCQWSPRTGMFYLNVPEVNGTGSNTSPGAVLQINPKSEQVVQVFPIPHADCAGNQGMSIGPNHQILLGCSNSGPGSVIISEDDGHVIANLPGENGNDEVWYNFGDNSYYMAESNHTGGPVLGIVDATGPGSEDTSAISALGSHSVAAEPFSNHIYVPVNNVAGAAGGAQSKVCSTANAGIADTSGCVAIYAASGKEDKCAEKGAPVLAFDPDGPQFLKIEDCQTDRDHDHDR